MFYDSLVLCDLNLFLGLDCSYILKTLGGNYSYIVTAGVDYYWIQSREKVPAKGTYFWEKGQPDNAAGSENCVAIKNNDAEKTMRGHDENCDTLLPFYCQTVSYDDGGSLWGPKANP